MAFESVVFIIDAQGFYIDGKFIARELAIKGKDFEKFYEFDSCRNYGDLSEKDKRTTNFCTTHVHGINLELTERPESSPIPIALFQDVLKYLYNKYRSQTRTLVCLRHSQLKAILDEMEIPVLDVSSLEIMPKLSAAEKPCSLHKNVCCNDSAYRCALVKVRHLYKCIQQTR